MNRFAYSLAFLSVCLTLALPARAQNKRLSPHETISAKFGGKVVMVVYGRPYTNDPKSGKARTVWGGKLVPYGSAQWRLGADEATLLISQNPLQIGGVNLPAGATSLYFVADDADNAKLIINRQVGQWGLEYHEDQDVARVALTKSTLETPIHQFTMAIEKSKGNPKEGILHLRWETTEYSVPFTVL